VSFEHSPFRSQEDGPAEKLLTRRQAAEFLTEQGYPTSVSTLAKLSMPSVGEGPPCEGLWGNRMIYRPSRLLRWAKERFRSISSAVAILAVFCVWLFD
jgi:hypothetical protein